MHGIGRDAGRRWGLRAFDAGDQACSSGYYHGVVEAVMARRGAAALKRDAAGVCAPFRRRGRHGEAHYNCVHGMGHGFMGLYRSDVFRSLRACAGLRDRWERRHCVGGVFMENLTAMSDPDRPSRDLRPERPLYPCTAVASRYKHECYMKQTAYVLYLRNDDFAAAFAICAGSPDVAFRADCAEGLGGDASIRASKYVTGAAAKRATTRTLCLRAPTAAARRSCVIGAVTVIVRDGATAATNPVAFCRGFRDRALRGACARAHLDIVRDLATGAGAASRGLEFRGHAASFVCRQAAALEAASSNQKGKSQ